MDYKAFVFVVEDAFGRITYPLVRGEEGFCKADVGHGVFLPTEVPNILLDEKEDMLSRRAARDRAKAAAKAKPNEEDDEDEDMEEEEPAGAAPKSKGKAKAKSRAKAKAAGKAKAMKTALKRPAAHGTNYVEMFYKSSCTIAVRQRFEPKRQVASSGGARYKDCDVDGMRAVGREAVALMDAKGLSEEGASAWNARRLTEKFGK